MSLLLLRRATPTTVGNCRRSLSQQVASATTTAAAAPLPLQQQPAHQHQQQSQQQSQQQPASHQHQHQHQRAAPFPSAFLQAALNGAAAAASVSNSGSSAKSGPAGAEAAASVGAGKGGAGGAAPSATSASTTTTAPPRPYPAHLIDGREDEEIERWCQKTPQPVSLRTLVQVGLGRRPFLSSLRDACSLRDALQSLNTRLQISANAVSPEEKGVLRMATFLHRELPIRFARGVQFIDRLDLYREAPDLRRIREAYVQSFKDVLQSPPPVTPECEAEFVKLLEGVRDRHADELLMVARGVYQLRARLGVDVLGTASSFDELHAHLDELHMKRIALRILVQHYIALHLDKRPDYVGLVCLKTRLRDVVEVAVNDARWICRKRYGRAPRVEVVGDDLTMAIIPENLYYVCLELIKNSLRAVSERYYRDLMAEPPEASEPRALDAEGDAMDGLPAFATVMGAPTSRVPPIRVTISRDYSLEHGQQVQIQVADEGGGIPPQDVERVFCYLFTTSEGDVQESVMGKGANAAPGNKSVPLAGLGYGLPIARNYSRYFGGDLSIQSDHGKGCTVTVTLNQLGECKERFV